MKRFVWVVVLVAACGGKSKPAEPPPEQAAPENSAPAESEPPPAEPAASTSGLPACDEYIALVEKYMTCDKVAQDTRDSARQGIESLKAGWGDTSSMPEDAKRQTNDACAQANAALREGAQAMGCPL